VDDQVDQRLKNNPKVRVEAETYAYQVNLKRLFSLLWVLAYVVFSRQNMTLKIVPNLFVS
jgi:hypothetical protein